jgi:hypothetical protein
MIETAAWLGLFASTVLAARGLIGQATPLLGAAAWVSLGTALLTGLASAGVWTTVWLWSFGINQVVGLLRLLAVLTPIGRYRSRMA